MTRVRYLAIGLAVSLAVNLFLIGYMAGTQQQGQRHMASLAAMHAAGPMDMSLLRGFVAQLSPTKQRSLRQDYAAARKSHMRKMHRIAALRGEIGEALRAPALDLPAIRARYQEMRALTSELQMAIEEAALQAAAQLSPQERIAVLDAMAREGDEARWRGYRHAMPRMHDQSAEPPEESQ
ncbi:MAG: periplasmic heavy metal sensor [Pseudomonadota bacterium]